MESNSKNDIKVGVFVALGVAVLAASIMMLGGDRWIFTRHYRLIAQFDHVQGVTVGSVISLVGVPVGNVKNIRFIAEKNRIEVWLDIDRNYMSRITAGSVAGARTQGALGDKYIYITPGPLDAPALKNGDLIMSDNKPDFLESISEKAPQLAQIADVVREANTLLSNLNKGNRSALFMENLVASSKSLNSILKDKEIKNSVKRLSNILEKIDKGQGSLGAIVNNPALHNRLMGLLGDSPRNTYLKPLIRATIQSRDSNKR